MDLKLKLEKEINTEANRNAADERAVEEMMKIYEPIVKTVDDDYSVEITFMGYEAAKWCKGKTIQDSIRKREQ